MFNQMLEPDYGVDDSPPDATNINQFIMYFGTEEFVEFKRLMKEAMRKEYPDSYLTANSSDTMLKILRTHYGNTTP
jgi:hypothetical protein